MSSPFRVGEQVTGEFFTDRAPEVKRILKAMRDPTRLLVYGERRLGKSSAIRQAALRAERDGVAVVWVDIATATSLADVTRRIVSGVPYGWVWREDLQTRLVRARLRIEARPDLAGNPVLSLIPYGGPPNEERDREDLGRILGALDEVTAGPRKRVVVVLDEFQEIDEVAKRGAWILRDIMQTTHNTSFICAGSRTGLIDKLTGPDGPFHRFFESLTVGPLPPEHFGNWMESRMEGAGMTVETGVGAEILSLAGPRTQDCLQLARSVFGQAAGTRDVTIPDVAAALGRTVLEDADRFETIWKMLAKSQQGVLRAVAVGERKLGSVEVRERYTLPSTPAITKAVRALQSKRHLSSGEPVVFDDPFFREWVLLRAMPDGLPEARLEPT